MINYSNDFNQQHSTILGQDEGSKEEAFLTKDVFTEKGEDLYEEMLFFFTGRIKSERSRKERSISFPLRLMYALECGKFSHIINWKVDTANQHCIQIHDTAALSKDVLPSLFKVAKFESFQRKLYRWGFIKHRPSKKKSSAVTFVNPAFRKGDYVNAAKISCSPKKNFRPDPNEILRRNSLGGGSVTSSFNPSSTVMRIDGTKPVVLNNDMQKVAPPSMMPGLNINISDDSFASFNPSIMSIDDTAQPVLLKNNNMQKVTVPSMMPGLNISSNDSFASSVPSLHSTTNEFMPQIPTSTIAMNTFMSNANNSRNANFLKMSDLAQSMRLNPRHNNHVSDKNTLQTQTAIQSPEPRMFAMPDHYHGSSMRHQMIIQNALNALKNDIGSNNREVQNFNQNILS